MPTGIETVQYVYDALGNRIKEAWTDARGAIDYSYLPGNYLSARGSTSYGWVGWTPSSGHRKGAF